MASALLQKGINDCRYVQEVEISRYIKWALLKFNSIDSNITEMVKNEQKCVNYLKNTRIEGTLARHLDAQN